MLLKVVAIYVTAPTTRSFIAYAAARRPMSSGSSFPTSSTLGLDSSPKAVPVSAETSDASANVTSKRGSVAVRVRGGQKWQAKGTIISFRTLPETEGEGRTLDAS